MSLPVDVRSLDALREVRAALVEFAEDSQHALGSMDLEIRRLLDWLVHEQKMYWEARIKERRRDLEDARSGLHRKRLSAMYGGEVHASEQKERLREAKLHLEEAEEQLERLKRWLPLLERAVGEYKGSSAVFAESVGEGIERSIRLLDRMIDALEEYAREHRTSRTGLEDAARSTATQPGSDPRPERTPQPSEESAEETDRTAPEREANA